MRKHVEEAAEAMSDARSWLTKVGTNYTTAVDVAFTCGVKCGRLDSARTALIEHETRSERARAAAKKARKS